MKRFVALGLFLLALVAPARGKAATPYIIRWELREDPGSCEDAQIDDGAPYFHANGTALPTRAVPGAYVGCDDSVNGTTHDVGEAKFDSLLLQWGTNHISFGVVTTAKSGTSPSASDWCIAKCPSECTNGTCVPNCTTCVRSSNIVHLISEPLGLHKPLFNFRRTGAPFFGVAPVDLSLEEINPPLARDIANLEAEIKAEREWLYSHASSVVALTERLDMLQQLDAELHDLVKRPLDEFAQTDLDAIFDRYSEVLDDATRAALKQLLDDLKKSVLDLEDELFRLIDEFGGQADAVVDLATANAQADGFDPDDPSAYGLSPADTPWIEVPDVSKVQGAFEDGNDPYAAYADAVLATLSDFVQGGNVVARGSFAANVRAWRANQAALEKALKERTSVSQAETNAFLNAQIKVTSYVQQFMDASSWYLDTPVPAHLRADVDGVLLNHFGPLAEEMKDNLNQWEQSPLELGAAELVETIDAFAGAISSIGEITTPYFKMMGTLVHATSRVAIGFVPIVGPTMDLCEAVTGKMFCLPGGKDLSTEERIFSAVGFGVGSVFKAYSGVKNAGINPAGKAIAAKVLTLGEEFAEALQASRRASYKTLRGAATTLPVNEFEKKAALHLMKQEGRGMLGVGDDGVRKVLGIPKDSLPGGIEGKAPDFLSVTKDGKLALTEAKGVAKPGGVVDTATAVDQLQNAMNKMKELNLIGDVRRVEIIKPWDAKLPVNFKVKDGYLINPEGETVAIEGVANIFVRIIEL